MERILFFDTETNGLPKDWNAPGSYVDNWPEAVSIAWAVASSDGDVLSENYFVLNREDVPPQGWDEGAARVHGISRELSASCGFSAKWVMKQFQLIASQCQALVAHNLSFDIRIVEADMMRLLNKRFEPPKTQLCTMHLSTEFCAIPSPYKVGQYKWPKLEELHHQLFNEGFGDAHNALADVRACVRCFFEMKNKHDLIQAI